MLGADPLHNTPHGEGAPIPRDPDVWPPTFPEPATGALPEADMFDDDDRRKYQERQEAIDQARKQVEEVLLGPEPANDSARNFVSTRLDDVAWLAAYDVDRYHDARNALIDLVKKEHRAGNLRLEKDSRHPEADSDQLVWHFVTSEIRTRVEALNTGADRRLFTEQLDTIKGLNDQNRQLQETVTDLRRKLAGHVGRGYELENFLGSRLSPEDMERAKSMLKITDIEPDAFVPPPEVDADEHNPSTADRVFFELTERLLGKKTVEWVRSRLRTKRPPQSAEVAVVEKQDAN